MKINQVEELVGITKKNIRFYEDEGLITPERNPENGYREYTLKDVDLLLKIKFLRKIAVPIEEIRALQTGKITFDQCMERQLTYLNHQQTNIKIQEEFLKKLITEVDDLDKLNASECLSEMKRMEEGGTEFLNIAKTDIKIKKRGSMLAAMVIIAILAGMLFFLLYAFITDGLPLGLLILFAALVLIPIVGISVALKQRLKELNGGEEDEASKY